MMSDMAVPVFRYDAACAFCRLWVERWKKTTEDRVLYQPFDGPRKSSEFTDEHGRVSQGAEGVFRLLATSSRGRLLWWYKHVPFFRPLSECGYRLVSSCRVCAYKITKLFLP